MEWLVETLRAAGEPTRLRILALLARGELTVSEITQILGQSQPRISRHLKLLVDAGLLERKPEGSWAFYRLAHLPRGAHGAERMRLAREIGGLVPADDRLFAADLGRLESVKAARIGAAQAYFNANAGRWNSLRSLHVPQERVEQAILALVGPGPFGHVLDLGTGTGRMLELLAGRVTRGEGIDTSHEMLTIARTVLDQDRFRHLQVRHGDIFSLRASGKADLYDLVLIHQVLHYLANPASAVAEAARVLAPGGRVLIVDFAPHAIEALRAEHAHRRLGFAAEEVSEYLTDAGLMVDRIEHLTPEGGSSERLTVTLWRAAAPRP